MSQTLEPAGFPSDSPLTPAQSTPSGLSEGARLIDTFVAPSKTFADIKRSSRWWLPFLVSVLVTYGFVFAMERQVGWAQVVDNVLKQSPKQQERFSGMEPSQAAEAKAGMASSYKYVSYASPLFTLLFAAVGASVLLMTINFGFGGEATFGRMFAVWMYATVPLSIKGLLGIVVLYAGMSPDQFQLQNAVGTNLGYYLAPDTSKGLLALASSIDIVTLWVVALLVIGCAIVGNVKRPSAAIAVVGWWVLVVLAGTAFATVQG